ARALYDPVLGRLRELAAPGLVMNGSPDEGALLGTVKPAPEPPGRGVLVDRRPGARRVQLAWLQPAEGAARAPSASRRRRGWASSGARAPGRTGRRGCSPDCPRPGRAPLRGSPPARGRR